MSKKIKTFPQTKIYGTHKETQQLVFIGSIVDQVAPYVVQSLNINPGRPYVFHAEPSKEVIDE